MIWFVLYLIIVVAFLLWWKSAHYRTPDEEARDIEEEAKYWRDEAERKNEFNEDWKEYIKRMKIILYGDGSSPKPKGVMNADCKEDKEWK